VKLDIDGVMSSEHTVSSYELWATVINFKPTEIPMVTGFSVDHVNLTPKGRGKHFWSGQPQLFDNIKMHVYI